MNLASSRPPAYPFRRAVINFFANEAKRRVQRDGEQRARGNATAVTQREFEFARSQNIYVYVLMRANIFERRGKSWSLRCCALIAIRASFLWTRSRDTFVPMSSRDVCGAYVKRNERKSDRFFSFACIYVLGWLRCAWFISNVRFLLGRSFCVYKRITEMLYFSL